MEFMPVLSPLVLLAFLGTVAGTVCLAAATIVTLALGKRPLFRIAAVCALALPAGYLATVLVFSLASHEKVLSAGQYKYFCEMDCHIAYSVVSVAKTRTLDAATAQGTFYVVTTKIWFDEKTIGEHRGDSPLQTESRLVLATDDRGRTWPALGKLNLDRPLRPGESFTRDLVFDLPDDAAHPRMLITDQDGDWVTSILIGHEKSLLHKKIWFGIGA